MIVIYKIICIILSYLLGSVLFSELSMRLFHGRSLIEDSPNHNPGASNAFKCGGTACGMLAVIGDVGKGFLPVFFYKGLFECSDLGMSLVMAAVVLGHAFPIFFHFKGGMCIAVTFGVLLGFLPAYEPFLILTSLYVTFLIAHKHSNSSITVFVFILFSIICSLLSIAHRISIYELIGILFLSVLVCIRIWPDISSQEQEQIRNKLKRTKLTTVETQTNTQTTDLPVAKPIKKSKTTSINSINAASTWQIETADDVDT